jgi:hypothetical protein
MINWTTLGKQQTRKLSEANFIFFGIYIGQNSLERFSVSRCMQKPVLIALMAGAAAHQAETIPDQEVVNKLMKVLSVVVTLISQMTVQRGSG